MQTMGFCSEARNRKGVAENMEEGVTEVQELWKKWHFRQSAGRQRNTPVSVIYNYTTCMGKCAKVTILLYRTQYMLS